MRFLALASMIAVATAAGAGELPSPLTDADFAPVRPEEAALGQLLFYDPILSGNREVACATCHHPAFGTSDGLSLSLGDGGIGLGPRRIADPDNLPEQRVPRNAQSLFNLGATAYTVLFHDGRIEADPSRPGGLRTPLDADMRDGFASPLSAQSMFPVLSPDEMAGHYSENEVAQAVRQGRLSTPGGAWDLIAARVAAVPDYAASFEAVYDHIHAPSDIGFTDISNAIAAFMEAEWRSDTSPFDARLRGEAEFSPEAEAGLQLFYGKAGCADCHGGPLLTDFGFHVVGQPQIGPGKGARFETHARDEGRFRVTGHPDDYYAFRTPSLRNVMHTGPWGHAGAYSDLRAFVSAHLDPKAALSAYDRAQAVLPTLEVADWRIIDDPVEVQAISDAVAIAPVTLTEAEIDELLAFLKSLSDSVAIAGRLGVPKTVPSGLKVPRP